MQKQKSFDWKDSNMALFGSDTDRGVKKESAQTEKAWKPVEKCNTPHLFTWRIEQFHVKEWPTEEYGKFYSGDSYIILNVYKHPDSPELLYDVHFWIGKESTADEYGTAAYKTVELDTLLDDRAVQHREVQGHESELFKSYFKEITYLKGGCGTGFRHVETKEYQPRLFHVSGARANVVVCEVDTSKKCLNSDDVFILDMGSVAYQWNGKTANKDEKFKASQYLRNLASSRNGKTKIEVLEETEASSNREFLEKLGDHAPTTRPGETNVPHGEKALYRLSDSTGSIKFEKVSTGSFKKNDLVDDDVSIIDNGDTVYVYIGSNASASEKKNALTYAHNYLQSTAFPYAPVTVIDSNVKGKSLELFNKVFVA